MALRIVVVGLGGRGRDWIGEVRTHPEWELAAVVDTDPAVLGAAPTALGTRAETAFADLEDALAATTPDAVLVATPPGAHVRPCCTALEGGAAVLVEKPFTLMLSEAVDLVGRADAAGRPLLVAQNYRYLRWSRAARRVVRGGALGEVGLVVGHYYRVPHEMAPSLARLPHRVLWGMAVHHLDTLRFILDRPVVGVLARSFNVPWDAASPAGGSLEVLLEFEGGARATYGATYQSSGHEYFGAGQEFYQRFVGERATLHVVHRWLLLCKPGRLPRWVPRGSRRRTEEALLLDQFATAVRDGGEAECSGRDNLQTVAISEACIRSSDENRWVNPQELLRGAG